MANFNKIRPDIMMKSIVVPRIVELPQEAVVVPAVLDAMAVPFEPVAMVNWPDEFPYCPDVAVRMAWCPRESFCTTVSANRACVQSMGRTTERCGPTRVWSASFAM